MNVFLPKVSIITVVYNGEKTLEKTIQSVINQSYKNVEYIIVDGNSNDQTVEIIKKYDQFISIWISEPDNGIYDAMNKGINLASGDYLWFMNSGDEIYNIDTLEETIINNPDADVYYGETIMIDDNGVEIGDRRLKTPEVLTWKSFEKGMLVSHQSFIVKKALVDNYDTRYKFSSDFKWCLSALKKANKICNTNLILSKFLDGGYTKQNIIPGLKERFKIMVHYYGLFSTLYQHIFISIKFVSFILKHKRF